MVWLVAFILIPRMLRSLHPVFSQPHETITAVLTGCQVVHQRRSAYLCLAGHAVSSCKHQDRKPSRSVCVRHFAVTRQLCKVRCGWHSLPRSWIGSSDVAPQYMNQHAWGDTRAVREVIHLHGNRLHIRYIHRSLVGIGKAVRSSQAEAVDTCHLLVLRREFTHP